MKTAQELVNRVLVKLNVTATGQTPSAEDFDLVSDILPDFFDMMRTLNVVYIPDPDAIDGAIFLPLADRLAMEVAQDFGLGAVPDDVKEAANGTIRQIGYSADTYAPTRFCSF